MSILAIVQARLGSKRLPNKVLKKIKGFTIIQILIERLRQSKLIDKIVVAVPENYENQFLADHIEKINCECFRGSENNVLDRFYKLALKLQPQTIVRITGDCPLVDPILVDQAISKYVEKKVDYLTNGLPPTFPDGLDIEVFSFEALKKCWLSAKTEFEKEHVTTYIKNSNKFKIFNIENNINLSDLRWTLDEPEDYHVLKQVFNYFHPNIIFSWVEVYKLYNQNSKIFNYNKKITRNEGEKLNSGQKLWKRAKKIIPGGNMLLSKRSEMFLPNFWPSYFSKASGCKVWDLDNNMYTDVSIMGIGTNILGYGNELIDNEISKVVSNGNMSTFNCPEEVYLAERLVELHPWSEMVRFARTGGEANSIAIRIARASSNKDKIAVCGYHGWHDWYLAANLSKSENLNNHLLPGLMPKGVPNVLSDTIYPFQYNDYEGLKKIINENDIGVIKMEVSRNKGPENNFLKKVRELASKNNIILIFDECTSGFRQSFGGLHKLFDVDPDMAIFGKALGNGYPITAIIGKREIMEEAQTTFISSTFWTDRIGPVAGLKTLDVMEKVKPWKYITELGIEISENWKKLALENKINIKVSGLPALTNFSIESKDWLKYKTFITQEMLKKGFLATNTVYVSTAHSRKILDNYYNELSIVFQTIKNCEEGMNIDKLLDGPVCHSGFQRLN